MSIKSLSKKNNLPYVLGSALLLFPLKKSSDNVTVISYSHEKTYGLTHPIVRLLT